MDLTEAKGIKNKWQEYTELYKKGLNDPDNHDGVVTHLELDILDCEVMRVLGNMSPNKASGGDGNPANLFKILKMTLLKCCMQYASKFGKLTVATGLEKVSFHSNTKERQCQRKFKLL